MWQEKKLQIDIASHLIFVLKIVKLQRTLEHLSQV